MIDDREFARRIRAARAYLGLNLEEAGEALGISAHRLSRRERADKNGMKMTVADRFHITAVYCDLTGWPPESFTAEPLPPIPNRRSAGDDLTPADVVDRVDPADDGGAAERP